MSIETPEPRPNCGSVIEYVIDGREQPLVHCQRPAGHPSSHYAKWGSGALAWPRLDQTERRP